MSRPRLLLALGALGLASCATPAERPAAPPATAPAAPSPAPLPAWHSTPPPGPLTTPELAPPSTREEVLPNGLRVVVVEHHARPVVVVRLVLPQGTVSDPPGMAGATSLAVRLLGDFYEQTSEGKPLPEEKSLRRQVVDLGGIASTQAEADFASVGIAGYALDLHRYLRLVSAAVLRPRHGEESFGARRNQLLDALEDLETSDPEAFEQAVTSAAFGAEHPYGRSPLGTLESLRVLGLENVEAQQRQVLSPRGATLLIVGDVDAEKALGEARAAFQRWRGEPARPPPVSPPSPAPARGQVGFLKRQPAVTLTACAARPLPATKAAAHEVLAALLGGGLESRLNQVLRTESGLTYTAGASVVRHRYASALLACASLEGAQAELGLGLFRKALESVRAGPPTAEELERAKAVRLAELGASQDDAAHITAAWVRALALGEGVPHPAEERAAIEKVTAEEVAALAAQLLKPEALHWTLSGDPEVAAKAVAVNKMGHLRPVALER